MIRRVLPSGLLALCLALTSLAAIVAETRMAAAGGYCGTGAPQILLDDAGLPVLDGAGDAVALADCPVCHLAFALSHPAPHSAPDIALLRESAPANAPLSVSVLLRLDHHARAPPRPA
ncbi:DUF2946 family protein [Gymnodinialimonas ulvae]|uniref:DUF2946 family protein n=1 Tax=Gymnodinialimonas ulvae TaxID=3126504 RepID=UPI00309798C9